jgi:2-methylcitrate dehydratase PrpD
MRLPDHVLVQALGICGSQAAALQEFLHDGTWVKKIHPGWGGHSAIYALLMAKEGLTGPSRVFEGDFGLWKTHLGTVEGLEEEMNNLGGTWHTPEITFKMYPVCHMTHSFIDCMFELKRLHNFVPDDIASVECRIEPRCYHIVCEPSAAKSRPRTDYMMRFSLPYVTAIAAIKNRVSPSEIDLKYAEDPAVRILMGKVHCIPDETKKNPGYFPGWMKVTMKNGAEYTAQRLYELGTMQNPIKKADVVTKFENNMNAFYSKEQINIIGALIAEFDRLEGVSELVGSLHANT